ncbi:MAG: DedA family protein [Calditrichia bacterium]
MIEELGNILHSYPVFYAYLFLFFAAYIENIFPPAPADTVVVFGAYLVGRGILSYEWVLISTTLGSVSGFMTLFILAFWFEKKILEKKFFKWVNSEAVIKVEHWFHHYGYWIVAGNRFLSGFRSIISIVAGFTKMNPAKILILSGLSALCWNAILIYAGYLLGDNWDKIGIYLKNYSIFIILLAVIITVVWMVKKFRRR